MTAYCELVQLTHSATGKTIFHSQVNIAEDDKVDEDEAGGWVLSAFTGKTYFEREYRREDLDDLVRDVFRELSAAGDRDWTSFADRFKNAILGGYFHIVDINSRECKVIVDNEVHSRSGSAASKLETIEIEMHPVNHATRGEKIGEFLFECAGYFQAHGCSLNPVTARKARSTTDNAGFAGAVQRDTTDGRRNKSYDDMKLERDALKAENAELKKEVERLHSSALRSGSKTGSLGAASGRPKSKAQMNMLANAQMFKKRKGASALNPRMKKGIIAKGTEFGSEDDEDDDNK